MSEGRRYKIHHVIGQGGFGTVYAAELMGEGGFTRKVALKVLNADMAGIEDVANRLRDEARLLGLLRHRAIVQVDGLVMLNGRWTVVMEHIEGADLQKVVRGAGPMPLGCALEVVSEVASALDIAYATPGPKGVPLHLLHRDIKPPNILLTSAGEAKVLDFGIARAEFSEREAQTKSVLYGSIGYMAPERMEFQELPAGDVFALGAVLFEILDGSPIGKGSINPNKHKAFVDSNVQRLLKKLPIVPPEFPELLCSMLAYDPEERPSAREVERRCRALRTAAGEPWLRDWAEKVVPGIVKDRGELKSDDFSGSIVVEHSARAPAGRPADPPRSGPPAPVLDGPSSTYRLDPPRRRGGGGVWMALGAVGCLTVLVVGGAAAAVMGTGVAGGVLAVVLANQPPPQDTGHWDDPVPPPVITFPGGDDPIAVDTDVEEDPAEYGLFGMKADLVEPWKSAGLPIGNGVVGYCDASSIVVTEQSSSERKVADRYVQGLQSAGWSKTYEYAMEDTVSLTLAKGSKTISLTTMAYEGSVMISATMY
jgi:serine/threonine protein kinase